MQLKAITLLTDIMSEQVLKFNINNIIVHDLVESCMYIPFPKKTVNIIIILTKSVSPKDY